MAHLLRLHPLVVVVTNEAPERVDVVIEIWIVVVIYGIDGIPGVMVDPVEVGVTATSGEDLEVTEKKITPQAMGVVVETTVMDRGKAVAILVGAVVRAAVLVVGVVHLVVMDQDLEVVLGEEITVTATAVTKADTEVVVVVAP